MKKGRLNIAREMTYKGKKYMVISVDINDEDGTHEVLTDKGTLRLTSRQFIEELIPARPEESTTVMKVTEADYSDLKKLSTIVMASIEKLQTDAGFVDQAHAINEGAKVLIETKRLVLDAYRTMRELQ